MALRTMWPVLVGAWASAWVVGAALRWLLGADGTWANVAIVAAALVGGAFGVRAARDVRPMTPAERRDTILGWGALAGGVAAVACLFFPLPWGALAAAAVLGATTLALRRAAS